MAILVIGDAHGGPETDYVVIYKKITSATQHQRQGRFEIARQLFTESLDEIKAFQQANRGWNPGIINYRIKFIREKLEEIGEASGATAQSQPEPADSMDSMSPEQRGREMTQQLAADQQILTHLKDRVESLESEKIRLQQKLREALTAGPEQVDPKEVTEARREIRELTIENQLLRVQLAESVKKAAEIAPSDEVEQKVLDLSDQITVLTLEKKGLQLEIDRLRNQSALPERTGDGPAIIPTPEDQQALQTLELAVADLEARLEKAQQELLQVTQSEATLRRQLDAISRVNDDLESTNASLVSQVRDLETQLANLDNLDHYKNHIAALESDLAAKDAQIKRLTDENRQLAASNLQLQNEIRQLTVTNRELKDIISSRDRKIAEMQEDFAIATDQFEKQIRELEREKMALQQSMGPGTRQDTEARERLESRYAMIQREVEQLQQTNERLKDENQLLRQWLDQLAPEGFEIPDGPIRLSASGDSGQLPEELSGTNVPRLAVFQNDTVPMREVRPGDLAISSETEKPTVDNSSPEPVISDFPAMSRMAVIEEELNAKLRDNPRDLEARNRMAALLMDKSEFGKAREFVDETISLFPQESEPLVLKALLERQESKFKQAISHLAKAIELNPKNPNAHMLLGTLLSELGHRKAAEESLRRAVRLDPENPLAHFNLSVAYLYQDPPYRALAQYHYNEAVRLGHPRDSEIEIRIQRTP